VASAGEKPNVVFMPAQLQPVAIELDLMDPLRTLRYLFGQRREAGAIKRGNFSLRAPFSFAAITKASFWTTYCL
jgi:hypothetical protein